MKRLVLIALCVLMVVAPLSPVVAQDDSQHIFAVLFWNVQDSEFSYSISERYSIRRGFDIDREGFQELWKQVEDNDPLIGDYLAVFGISGFDLSDTINGGSFIIFIFEKEA